MVYGHDIFFFKLYFIFLYCKWTPSHIGWTNRKKRSVSSSTWGGWPWKPRKLNVCVCFKNIACFADEKMYWISSIRKVLTRQNSGKSSGIWICTKLLFFFSLCDTEKERLVARTWWGGDVGQKDFSLCRRNNLVVKAFNDLLMWIELSGYLQRQLTNGYQTAPVNNIARHHTLVYGVRNQAFLPLYQFPTAMLCTSPASFPF